MSGCPQFQSFQSFHQFHKWYVLTVCLHAPAAASLHHHDQTSRIYAQPSVLNLLIPLYCLLLFGIPTSWVCIIPNLLGSIIPIIINQLGFFHTADLFLPGQTGDPGFMATKDFTSKTSTALKNSVVFSSWVNRGLWLLYNGWKWWSWET